MRRVARVLATSGPFLVVLGLSKYHARFIAEPHYSFSGSSRMPWALAFIGLLLLASYAVGLPDGRPSRRGAVVAAMVATFSAAVGISLAQLAVGVALLPRFVVVGSALVLVPWYVLCARLAVDVDARARSATRVVVVGDLADVSSLWLDLEANPVRPATIAGVLTCDEAAVRKQHAPIVELVRSCGANLVVLDSAAQQDASVVRQAAMLHQRGVRVRSLLGFYEEWLGKLPISELERVSMMFDIAEVHGTSYVRLKRLLDLTCGIGALVALALVTPIVVVGNLAGNRGPLMYRQSRVGKDGEPFTILKFRTMRVLSPGDDAATSWTTHDDPRITRWGGIMRRAHLDELPQAWNIIRGDISVVGPRPEQQRYVDELTDKLPFYPFRHLVRPGLTGWAQIMYGYAGDEQDALEKLQYEFFYLRHQSLALDLRIIVRSIRSVFVGTGRGR
jgi:lipopolysaccharide/colanic/teichoic acid biosynthesis glycosyltransferase